MSSTSSASASAACKRVRGEFLVDYVCVYGHSRKAFRHSGSGKGPTLLEADIKGELYRRLPPPDQDCKGQDFPPGVELFMFPTGVLLQRSRKDPTFHSFVLTMMNGDRLYGYCFTVHKKLHPNKLSIVRMQVAAELMGKDDAKVTDMPEELWTPECICLLSSHNFHNQFARLLKAFSYQHIVDHDTEHINEESMQRLFDLVATHRAPLPEAPPVTITLADCSCTFSTPSALHHPPRVECDFRILFGALEPRHIISVINGLLCEMSVCIFSNNIEILTPALEAIVALLYPMRWPYIYISLLPMSLVDIFEAPQPFLIGAPAAALAEPPWPETAMLVDLDNNTLSCPMNVEIDLPWRLSWRLYDTITKHFNIFQAVHPSVKLTPPANLPDSAQMSSPSSSPLATSGHFPHLFGSSPNKSAVLTLKTVNCLYSGSDEDSEESKLNPGHDSHNHVQRTSILEVFPSLADAADQFALPASDASRVPRVSAPPIPRGNSVPVQMPSSAYRHQSVSIKHSARAPHSSSGDSVVPPSSTGKKSSLHISTEAPPNLGGGSTSGGGGSGTPVSSVSTPSLASAPAVLRTASASSMGSTDSVVTRNSSPSTSAAAAAFFGHALDTFVSFFKPGSTGKANGKDDFVIPEDAEVGDVPMSSVKSLVSPKVRISTDEKKLRRAFLSVFLSLLKGYRHYINIPRLNDTQKSRSVLDNDEPLELFDKAAFEAEASDDYKEFVHTFLASQMFSSFVEERVQAKQPDWFDHRVLKRQQKEARDMRFHRRTPHRGMLWKVGSRIPTWHERYFELTGMDLRYFKPSNDLKDAEKKWKDAEKRFKLNPDDQDVRTARNTAKLNYQSVRSSLEKGHVKLIEGNTEVSIPPDSTEFSSLFSGGLKTPFVFVIRVFADTHKQRVLRRLVCCATDGETRRDWIHRIRARIVPTNFRFLQFQPEDIIQQKLRKMRQQQLQSALGPVNQASVKHSTGAFEQQNPVDELELLDSVASFKPGAPSSSSS